ncbi:MAG TPA: MMPL family transporter [Chloroflexota bacterium]|nr:MMPL family transporter [Chloroflexota bacterium]
MYRFRWLVLAVWGLGLATALPFLPALPQRLRAGGFDDPTLPAAQAEAVLREQLGLPTNALAIFFSAPGRLYAEPEVRGAVGDALERVRGVPGVVAVIPPDLNSRQIGRAGSVVYALVSLQGRADQTLTMLPEIEARAAVPVLPDGLRVKTIVAGGSTFFRDLQDATERDLQRAELVTLPVAAVALVVVFGSLAAASVPVVAGAATTLLGLAALLVLSVPFALSVFVLNLASMLALGLGTDYALFLVSRFREELVTRGTRDALVVTMATAGRAVFFSAGTVLVGLAGLLAFRFMLLRSLGIAGMAAVGAAVLCALTLLPALLAVLGPRINALRVRATDTPKAATDGGWARLARLVLRRPLQVLVPVVLLLAVLGAPFASVRLSTPDARILPPEAPSRAALAALAAEFEAGAGAPLLLAVSAPGPVTAASQLNVLYDLTRTIASDPRVARVESIVDLDPRLTREQYALLYAHPEQSPDLWARGAARVLARGATTLVTVVPQVDPLGAETAALVRALRATVPAPGWRIQVSGASAGAMDLTESLYRDFPRVAAVVIAVTYVLLLFTFRSVVLPAKAVVMNVLSLLASYGALAAVFQDGALAWLPPPLRIEPLGYVEATLPILLFCTLFGLSMDYEVFLLSRIQEAYRAGLDNAASVAAGLQASGRVITGAAAIVVVVAGSFALAAGVAQIKALGLGIAIAVLVDATIVRALLVPATMRLLGDWNWWFPGGGARRVADAT